MNKIEAITASSKSYRIGQDIGIGKVSKIEREIRRESQYDEFGVGSSFHVDRIVYNVFIKDGKGIEYLFVMIPAGIALIEYETVMEALIKQQRILKGIEEYNVFCTIWKKNLLKLIKDLRDYGKVKGIDKKIISLDIRLGVGEANSKLVVEEDL